MKKKISTLLLLAFATTLWSQSSIVKINTEKSNIHWLAKKVTGQHDGYISLTNGSLEMDGGQLTGGSFEVDMTSINVADLTGEYKAKLEGHLKSDDFFGIETFPVSNLTFTEVNQKMKNHYEITADIQSKELPLRLLLRCILKATRPAPNLWLIVRNTMYVMARIPSLTT